MFPTEEIAMKKMLCIMAASALCLCFMAGCGGSAEEISTNGENESEFLLQTQTYNQEYCGEDGKKLIGSCQYILPKMSAKTNDVYAQKVAESFNQEIASILDNEVDYWNDAMTNFPKESMILPSEQNTWTNEVNYALAFLGSMVSVRYEHYVYAGGAHGFTYYTEQMFDADQGKAVELDDLTDDMAALRKAVEEEILYQIQENDLIAQYGYWNDYRDYVARWTESGHGVYFSEDGTLNIVFGAYELASYAAGPQEFVIEQDVYKNYMNDYGKALLGIA